MIYDFLAIGEAVGFGVILVVCSTVEFCVIFYCLSVMVHKTGIITMCEIRLLELCTL